MLGNPLCHTAFCMWRQPSRCSCMPCFSAAAGIDCFNVHHQIVIKGNVQMSSPSCHVRMPCCGSGTSSDSDDALFIFSMAAQRAANVRDVLTNEFSQPIRRLPKVNRATDERTGWSRTGWLGHVDAKLRENSWNTYYHMHVAAFDELHSLLYTESEAQQITARRKALNSTPMGAIETEVKLACTLRQLFGEESKSLVDVFKISPTSERAAFMDVVARINACPELDGDLFATDHSIPVLERRAQDFADRSGYPTVFRHAIGAIDGLFIKTEQPEATEVGNVRDKFNICMRACVRAHYARICARIINLQKPLLYTPLLLLPLINICMRACVRAHNAHIRAGAMNLTGFHCVESNVHSRRSSFLFGLEATDDFEQGPIPLQIVI